MDDPGLDARAHHDALAGLERINRLSGSARSLFSAIRGVMIPGEPPLRVLDIASGGGDVAMALHRLAARRHVMARFGITNQHPAALHIDGCDISERAVAYAQDKADRAQIPVRYFTLDVLADPLPEGYDVVMCSLFLHHLDDDAAVHVVRKMAYAARRLVVVNDLRRAMSGYAVTRLFTHLLSRSRVVHVDGPRSVRAAFTCDEAAGVACRAGLRRAVVRRVFPWRWQLTWRP